MSLWSVLTELKLTYLDHIADASDEQLMSKWFHQHKLARYRRAMEDSIVVTTETEAGEMTTDVPKIDYLIPIGIVPWFAMWYSVDYEIQYYIGDFALRRPRRQREYIKTSQRLSILVNDVSTRESSFVEQSSLGTTSNTETVSQNEEESSFDPNSNPLDQFISIHVDKFTDEKGWEASEIKAAFKRF